MIVEIILITSLAVGAASFYWPEIRNMAAGIKTDIFLRRERQKTLSFERYTAVQSGKEGLPGLNESLGRLINITFGIRSGKAAVAFWIMSAAPPLIIFSTLEGKVSSVLMLLTAAFSAGIPSLVLMMRLQGLRVASSREGEILMTELLDNYKINYFNMQQAIEVTAVTIEEAPNCRRLLFDLSRGVNRAGGPDELKKLLNDFKFSVDTSWAGVLADNMYLALTSGIRVTEAMEDLVNTVSKAREVDELTNRENNEAGLILKYLAPLCYIMTVVGAVRYFGLTFREFINYQFCTEAGLQWFIAIAVSYGAAVCAKRFLTIRKLDL